MCATEEKLQREGGGKRTRRGLLALTAILVFTTIVARTAVARTDMLAQSNIAPNCVDRVLVAASPTTRATEFSSPLVGVQLTARRNATQVVASINKPKGSTVLWRVAYEGSPGQWVEAEKATGFRVLDQAARSELRGRHDSARRISRVQANVTDETGNIAELCRVAVDDDRSAKSDAVLSVFLGLGANENSAGGGRP